MSFSQLSLMECGKRFGKSGRSEVLVRGGRVLKSFLNWQNAGRGLALKSTLALCDSTFAIGP